MKFLKKSRSGSGRRTLGWLTLLGLGAISAALAPRVAANLGGGGFGLAGGVVGGGGTSAGGTYALSGVVPLGSGSGSLGGFFEVQGGVLPGRVVPVFNLVIQSVFTNKLLGMSWPEDATGYVLEYSPSVGPDAVWLPTDPQPTDNSFLSPCVQPARFFRLRKL